MNDKESWCKRETNSQFDITMGSYDGAETCELVGTYLLSKLSPQHQKKLGLYRDDGLGANHPEKSEKLRKIYAKRLLITA